MSTETMIDLFMAIVTIGGAFAAVVIGFLSWRQTRERRHYYKKAGVAKDIYDA